MKKIAFVLAVLLFAAPALAQTTVTITATQVPDTDQVEISYFADGNLPRAFGLDITVNYGVISSCTPAMVGECNDVVRGFGIFPGTIQIDAGGNVTDDGTPVAPFDDPGARGDIDSNGITVELGSLYVDGNEPPLGTELDPVLLCTITVTENCRVTIVGNAARCGMGSEARGVVMVDWTEDPAVDYVYGDVILDCFPTAHPDYDEWVAVGKPGCWCPDNDPDANPRQCHGDADGTIHGTAFLGYYWVGVPDLNILVSAWMVKEPPKGPGIGSVLNGICADFDHTQHGTAFLGYYRVGVPDLNILVSSWMVKEPPKGDGIPADCPD